MSDEKALEQKIDALGAQVASLLEAQRKRDELFEELNPVFKDALSLTSERLSTLEEKGYFAFGRGLLDVADHVVTGFTPDDLKELADSVVAILQTVRAMTQPHMLELAAEAGDAASRVDGMAPVGVMGMVRASRDEDVQKGMAVMLEVLRKVGRSSEKASRRQRLQAQLAPRRARAQPADARPPERPVAPVAPASASATSGPPPAEPPAPETVVVDGVEFTGEGFLKNPEDWTRELAENLAASIGVEMTDSHWKLIEFARADFAETGASPNIRRLTKSGIGTKEIYGMFPKAPGKCTALIAGLPKPVGCI